MAERHQPIFPTPPKPFAPKHQQVAEYLQISGLPQGTKVSVVGGNYKPSGNQENNVVITAEYDNKIRIRIWEDEHYPTTGASNTTRFLIEYPDGSSEVARHTFVVYPAQKFSYAPTLASNTVERGVLSHIPVQNLPTSARLEILDQPVGWSIVVQDATLTVLTSQNGEGTIDGRVTYDDGSTSPVSFSITAVDSDPASPTASSPSQPTVVHPPVAEKPTTVTEKPTSNVGTTVTTLLPAPVRTTVRSTTTVTLPVTETRTTTVASPVTTTTTVTQSVPTTIREPVPTTVDRTLTVTEQPPTVTATHQITSTQTHTEVSTSVKEPVPTTVKETVTEPVSVTQMSTSTVTQPVTVTQTATETATATQTATATAAPTTVTVTKTAAPEPAAGSSGSSTGGLIAVVVGVLAVIGGIAAFLVNQIPGLSNLLPI